VIAEMAAMFAAAIFVVVGVVVAYVVQHRRRSHEQADPEMDAILGPRVEYVVHSTCSDESKRVAELWRPRPDDVIVLTFPKTGTTWVQQICEMIRSHGSMAFDEIMQVQPWIDFAYDVGQDLDADHASRPRVFKSHQRPAAVQRGCKYIITTRAPDKTLISHYAFLKSKGVKAVTQYASVNEFAVEDDMWFSRQIFGTNYFEFLAEAWRLRHLPNVLVVSFELMIEDHVGHVRRIAEFLGADPSATHLARAVERSTKEFMEAHDHQFDDNFLATRQRELGRSKGIMVPTPKVTAGHGKVALSPAARDRIVSSWRQYVSPETGLDDYAALVDALREDMEGWRQGSRASRGAVGGR